MGALGKRFHGTKPAAIGAATAVDGSAPTTACGTANTAGTFTLKTRGDHTSTTAVTDTVDVYATTTFKDPAVSAASLESWRSGSRVGSSRALRCLAR